MRAININKIDLVTQGMNKVNLNVDAIAFICIGILFSLFFIIKREYVLALDTFVVSVYMFLLSSNVIPRTFIGTILVILTTALCIYEFILTIDNRSVEKVEKSN